MTIFKVVMNDELTNEEVSLVQEYWEHYGYRNIKFKHSIHALKIKAETLGIKNIKLFISKSSYVCFIGRNGICSDCQLPITALNRTIVKVIDSQDKKSKLCDKCLSVNSSKILKPHLEHLKLLIENNLGIINLSECKLLSYMERMHIYTILNMCTVNKSGEIKESKWAGFVEKEWGEENYIIKSLYNKKFTYKIETGDFLHNVINTINNVMKNIKNENGLIDQSVIDNFKELQKNIPIRGVYLKLPSGFKNYEEFEENIIRSILDRTIYEEDIYEIDSWLSSVALSKLNYLTQVAIQGYKVLKIKYDVELESLYQSMLNNYSIHECNCIINRAMYIASREVNYANTPQSSFKYIPRDKIYFFILKKTINVYAKSALNYKYIQDIDKILGKSDIELFIDSYISFSHIKWNHYNLRDILAIIVNSLKVMAKTENQDLDGS